MAPFVSGVLLAAGQGTRFKAPQPKQLLYIEGEPLVRRTARVALASSLAEVVVVIGHEAEAVGAALAGVAVKVVENPHHAAGQSTSLRAGLEALDPRAAAALFLPADQPFLTSALLDQLLATHAAKPGAIVVPTHAGRRGAPVLFDRAFFPALAALQGDTGGRVLLGRHGEQVVTVELESEAPLLDIDTVEDVERLLHAPPRSK